MFLITAFPTNKISKLIFYNVFIHVKQSQWLLANFYFRLWLWQLFSKIWHLYTVCISPNSVLSFLVYKTPTLGIFHGLNEVKYAKLSLKHSKHSVLVFINHLNSSSFESLALLSLVAVDNLQWFYFTWPYYLILGFLSLQSLLFISLNLGSYKV